MTAELRILILEDLASDAELMTRTLQRAGLVFTARRVVKREDFVREVAEYAPDIVLADFSLPGFDALSALGLARKLGPAVPFIVVTGHLDEETAVACLKAGADDYVLKEHLARLPAAVQSALSAHHARTERRRAEEAYRTLAESSVQGLVIFQGQRVVFANQSFGEMIGRTPKEIMVAEFANFQEVVHPDDRILVWGRFRERSAGKSVPQRYEFRLLHADGSTRWVEMHAGNILYQQEPAVQALLIDVTERKRAEEALDQSRQMLRQVVDSVPYPMFWKDADSAYLGANQHFAAWVGVASPDEVIGRRDAELCWTPEQSSWLRACDEETLNAGGAEQRFPGELRLADGRTLAVEVRLAALRGDPASSRGVTGVFAPVVAGR